MSAEFIEMINNGGKMEPPDKMTSLGLSRSVGTAALILSFQVIAFTFLRLKVKHVYAGRTCLADPKLYVPPSVGNPFSWVVDTIRYPTRQILEQSGINAYFFLRYILFLIALLSAQAILIIPVLVPLHATGRNLRDDAPGISTVLERLSIANITESNKDRYTAHLLLSIVAVLASCWMFKAELYTFYKTRADYLASQDGTSKISTTILLKGIMPGMSTEEEIKDYFGKLGKNIERIWLNRDYRDLEALTRRQAILTEQLEMTIVELLKRCSASDKSDAFDSSDKAICETREFGERWRHYIEDKDLPTYGYFQPKSIATLKNELSHVNAQIVLLRAQTHLFPQADSCFIQFDSRLSCFMAFRSFGSKPTNRLSPSVFQTDRAYPEDIIWTNLHHKSITEVIQTTVATTVEYLIIFGWAVPMALLSMVTQVEYIAQLIPSLSWLTMVPGMAHIIDGLLSPLLLSYLTGQVPSIFRYLALWKGFPTRIMTESDVQTYLFVFLYVQLFLIVTLSTGLPTLTVRLALNTTEGAMTLASTLPKATNFFISYLITTCCMTAGTALLQFNELFWSVWRLIRIRTPRQHIAHLTASPRLPWGSVYPLVTHLAAISMTYSMISPLILIVPVLGLPIVYLSYKYRMVYSYIPRGQADGNFYPSAIIQLFAGIYCSQVSLFGTYLTVGLPIHAIGCLILLLVTMLMHHRLSTLFHDLDSRVPLEAERKSGRTESPISLQGGHSSPTASPESVDARCLSARRSHFQNFVLVKTPQVQDYDDQDQMSSNSSLTFVHPCLLSIGSCIWLPHDQNGVALDQVVDIRQHYSRLNASCSGAQINIAGDLQVTKLPPDLHCTRL